MAKGFKALAGAAIGFVVGGPAGAFAGAQIGGTLDSLEAAEQATNAIKQGNEQNFRAQQQAAAAEARKAEIQNIRSMKQSIRQARIAAGGMVNTAAATGGMGGSGLAGGLSSVGAQQAGNLNYMVGLAQENAAISSATMTGAKAMSDASSKAADFNYQGQVAGAVAGVAGTIFEQKYGGWSNPAFQPSKAGT